MLLTGLLVALIVALILVQVVLGSALAQHRTDVPRNTRLWAGPSRSWQLNMLVHAQYDERGRRLKAWMVGLMLTQVAAMVIVIARVALNGGWFRG